jgi:hypothetical protein
MARPRHPFSDKPLLRPRRREPLAQPVEVDQAGNIHTPEGVPIELPGLTSDRVLKGLAEEAAGRMWPLREIIARRDRDGV